MMFTPKPQLSAAQLKRLGEHKYSSQCSTILDPMMQVFWNWLVQQIPMWLAPNVITLAGLVVNIVSAILLIAYSPDARIEPPGWTCIFAGVGLFIYQSLDAIDGKQARRTNSSTPLGELFDHGCDAMSTVFVIISLSVAIQIGFYPTWMFLLCFTSCFVFYVCHWQTYVSGTLRFGKIDVTEAQVAVIIIQIISGIFGSSIWATKIPVINLELKLLLTLITIVPATVTILSNLHIVFTGGIGKNGSTVAGSSVLSPLLPLCMVLIPACVIAQKSIYNIFEIHPCLYTLAFGLVSAKVSCRLVVAHMTKSEMDCLDTVLIGPGLLFLNQYFNNYINEYIVLWMALVFTCVDFSYYCCKVCLEICSYLKISLFKIDPPPRPAPKDDPVQPSTVSSTAYSRNAEFEIEEDEADRSFDDDGPSSVNEPLLDEIAETEKKNLLSR